MFAMQLPHGKVLLILYAYGSFSAEFRTRAQGKHGTERHHGTSCTPLVPLRLKRICMLSQTVRQYDCRQSLMAGSSRSITASQMLLSFSKECSSCGV